MVDVRYSVDPAELQTAAEVCSAAAERARAARAELDRVAAALPAYLPDAAAAAAVRAAIEAIELHTERATRGSEVLAQALAVVAERYAAADGQTPP